MSNEPAPGAPEFWAREKPEAIAVVDRDRTMTYGEWNEKSNRVADALSRRGLKAGDRLGMRFRLGRSWFIVQRALQKLGVAQVAVNWKLTASEAAYIIKDSGAKGLACNDQDVSPWASQNLGLLLTCGQEGGAAGERLQDLIEEGEAVPRFGALRPDMVLYTSGTTGRPKGVASPDLSTIDPQRLLRYSLSVFSVPPTPEGAVVLMSLPVHHGAGPLAATSACARGGTAVLLDPYDPEEALRLIEKHRVQVWTSVPTMLLRIQALPQETIDKYDLSSIEALATGAAPVPQSLKEWIIERFPDDVLWESYGASEVGMISYLEPKYQRAKPGSCGVPFDGVEIAIVDEDWNRLPHGTTGEIAVNTPTVLTRYLGHDALDEHTLKDGFYRTGDVGHLDEDGFLFITDRIKDMIVAGGVNIYPAEIEKALLDHPDVVNSAVIGVPQDDFGEQPLAFVVPREGSHLTAELLLDFLQSRLASFKKPRIIEFRSELPMNPMGKVLKAELRAPYWADRQRKV